MTKEEQKITTHGENSQNTKESKDKDTNIPINSQQEKHSSQPYTTENKPESLKKKIIKKFPFSTKTSNKTSEHNTGDKGTDDDELKNWKPVNLESTKKFNNESSNKQNNNNSKGINIASSFLSTLPKPKETNNDYIDMNSWRQEMAKTKEKKRVMSQLIIEEKEEKQQQQWDGEDEFMKKSILKEEEIEFKKQEENTIKESRFEEKEEENEVIEKIDWLNEKKSNKKEVNIADLVNKTWEKEQKVLEHYQNVYSDSSEEDDKKRINKNKKINK